MSIMSVFILRIYLEVLFGPSWKVAVDDEMNIFEMNTFYQQWYLELVPPHVGVEPI